MTAMVRIKGMRNIQWYPCYSLNSPLDSLDHKYKGMKDYSKRESINFMWWTEVTNCVDVNFEIQKAMEIWNFTFSKGYKMHFTSQSTSFSFSPVLLFHTETTLCAVIHADDYLWFSLFTRLKPTKCTMFFLHITLCTPTCFNPQRIITRKQVLNKISWNLTGYCFIHN